MKIVEPKIELWQQGENKITHVARCARVCYGRESGNDEVLYGNLERNKHWSMFRHETYYAAINTVDKRSLVFEALAGYRYCPYINYVTFKDKIYVVANGNFIRDISKSNPALFNLIYYNQIDIKEAENIEPVWNHLMRYTFCIVTQISTSRELNRVSPNNIAEQSTRYVYEDGTICRPHWLEGYKISEGLTGKLYIYKDRNTEIEMNNKVRLYIKDCERSFNNYKLLIDIGMPRQDARGILPLDTATKVIYTYSIAEWKHIIELRADKRAHPNAQIIANMIKDKLQELGYGKAI